MSNPIPLALYVHLPWCIRKCPYCDFNSRALKGALPAQAYTQALIRDFRLAIAELDGRPVETVFFGGGTPSLFPASYIAQLLSVLREEYPLSPEAEITLEANPGTREGIDFDALLEAGVNRLSVGAQTFDPDMLHRLGRIHTGDDIPLTVEQARQAGFAAGLGAALSMGDLGVIALFAGNSGATLPLFVQQLMGAYRMDQAAAAALVLVGISYALFWVFDRIGHHYADT